LSCDRDQVTDFFRNLSVSLNLTLVKNEKVKYYIKKIINLLF